MNKTLLIFLFSFFFYPNTSNASNIDNYYIVFCDYCSTYTQFENAAKVADSGQVLVFNLKNSVH